MRDLRSRPRCSLRRRRASAAPSRPARSRWSCPSRPAAAPTPARASSPSSSGKRWGQTVIVENKGGAAGQIGADLVAKAKPDGYTLLMGNIGTQAINPSLYPKLPYDPDKAFAPISLVAELPLAMMVNPQVPAKTAKEFIALAKASRASSATAARAPAARRTWRPRCSRTPPAPSSCTCPTAAAARPCRT